MAKGTRKNGTTATATRRPPRISEERQANGNGEHAVTAPAIAQRLPVLKTYKIYVGGKFPRSESGRYYLLKNDKGEPLANVCLCSRKDFRDAVVAARAAQLGWAKRSA